MITSRSKSKGDRTMPTIANILASKGSHIQSIKVEASVLEATQKMNQYKIGALVVMHEGQVAGIFTERDVLRRVVAEQRSPAEVTVGEVMTTEVICVRPETDIDEASGIMQQRKVRHLPVCGEDGNLQGMISIGDLNAFHATNQEQQIHFLNDYIYGRA
jgi:CBS domain-containing protein